MRLRFAAVLAPLMLVAPPPSAAKTPATELYQMHCASCHGTDRLGGTGPALLPENLARVRPEKAIDSITEGLPATQMPGFGETLDQEQIQSLADYIFTPLPTVPEWGLEQIHDSHIVNHAPGELGDTPVFQADLQNLFIVVELGDHHATILDGDRFEPIHRFATRYALHGGPKFSPDGRFVYLASRDGWVSKFDIYNLKTVAEIRAGINTRNAAVSADGRYVLVGNYLPHSLVVLDASDLTPLRLIPVADDSGRSSRVSAVYTAPPRQSFMVALKDLPEVWEIPYSTRLARADQPNSSPQTESDSPPTTEQTAFGIRRLELTDYLDDFFFDPAYKHLIGASREGGGQVVDLDTGRVVAKLDIPGMPHLGSGITWDYQGRPVVVTPNLREGSLSVIDMNSWEVIQTIETLGPGFFMRSHENTAYAWSDVFFGPNRDAVHVLHKETLEIVETLRPAPGKTAAHVEFTRDGRYALLSVWDPEGALVVYDGDTLEEVKRLPMRKPSGKYNVYNKTHYSRGTSH